NYEGVEPAAMGPSEWYAADDPVSIIGCADQAEVCYTPDSVCTGLIPLPDELGWWFDAWKNAGLPFARWPDGVGTEIKTFVLGLVRRSGFKDIVSKRGSDILSIKKYGLGYELQSDIPPNQWEREARVWFGTSIAKIQVSVMIKAFGSLSKKRRAVYARGNYTGESSDYRYKGRDLYCHQLKFRSSQHTTFSMLGLCCCLAMGSFLWLISLLDGLWMRRLFKYRPHRVLAWELDSAMQLIRQLHEHLQSGIWTTSGLHSAPLAFGTLGIATLDSNGTQHIPAYKIPSQGCNDDLLYTVTTLSRQFPLKLTVTTSSQTTRLQASKITTSHPELNDVPPHENYIPSTQLPPPPPPPPPPAARSKSIFAQPPVAVGRPRRAVKDSQVGRKAILEQELDEARKARKVAAKKARPKGQT
ncbi:MAG: hypothetical protein Q9184_007857, partial [Pyrenodesmia sp. 2 TL-2023]